MFITGLRHHFKHRAKMSSEYLCGNNVASYLKKKKAIAMALGPHSSHQQMSERIGKDEKKDLEK